AVSRAGERNHIPCERTASLAEHHARGSDRRVLATDLGRSRIVRQPGVFISGNVPCLGRSSVSSWPSSPGSPVTRPRASASYARLVGLFTAMGATARAYRLPAEIESAAQK